MFQDKLDISYKNLLKVFKSDRIKVTNDNKFVGFGSYKKAIDEADVVILATPPGFRPQHFEYAIAVDNMKPRVLSTFKYIEEVLKDSI